MIKKTEMISPKEALPGRESEMRISGLHTVLNTEMKPPFPESQSSIIVGLGCFWGAERLFWKLDGVYTTAVGYAGGYTPNPTYEEVCSGLTAHTEVVLVVYDRSIISLQEILSVFWQSHDPTQGMRQGNDVGTQYRSAIYVNNESDLTEALKSRDAYQKKLQENGFPPVSTEINVNSNFYYAEDYHQQYLDKNPRGYCGLQGTGVCF